MTNTKIDIRYIVVGDQNDGDYETQIFNATDYCKAEGITMQDFQAKVKKFTEMLKDNEEGHNWSNEYTDISLEDMYPQLFEDGDFSKEWEFLYDFVPMGEPGVHTIVSIDVSIGSTETIYSN